MEIDVKDVSLMDVSTWHQDVNETEALTYKHLPNQHIADWLLYLRSCGIAKGDDTKTINGTTKTYTNKDVQYSNALLELLAHDHLRRFKVLTLDANVEKVINEYERRSYVQ